MSEKAENTNRGMIATLVVVALAAVAIIVFAVTQLGGTGDDAAAPTETETSAPADDGADDSNGTSEETGDDVDTAKTTYLPEKMSGQEAIDALGDDLAKVAEMNNKTPEEFEQLLLKNPSAQVMPNGTILIP